MSKLTFLTQEQCFGINQLDILEKRGTRAAITDFSILLGGYVSDNWHIDSDNSLDKYLSINVLMSVLSKSSVW